VRVVSAEIPGVLLIEPDVHRDARGFFLETYHAEKYRRIGIAEAFVQDNHSRSLRGTLRGLHMQRTRLQGKLVRVVEGEIYDIAVDVRRGSPTFGRWAAATLSADNYQQLWIPPGFAHGFCVLSPVAQVEYKCTAVYDPADEIAIAWNDATLNITWPVADPILSARDSRNPPLAAVMDVLPSYG
jgi:dTDP-4-dehydrorhamnose 3,5-epimerase